MAPCDSRAGFAAARGVQRTQLRRVRDLPRFLAWAVMAAREVNLVVVAAAAAMTAAMAAVAAIGVGVVMVAVALEAKACGETARTRVHQQALMPAEASWTAAMGWRPALAAGVSCLRPSTCHRQAA